MIDRPTSNMCRQKRWLPEERNKGTQKHSPRHWLNHLICEKRLVKIYRVSRQKTLPFFSLSPLSFLPSILLSKFSLNDLSQTAFYLEIVLILCLSLRLKLQSHSHYEVMWCDDFLWCIIIFVLGKQKLSCRSQSLINGIPSHKSHGVNIYEYSCSSAIGRWQNRIIYFI